MDSFGNYPRERPFDPFSVMLFKALQVVAFLFFIALLVINPEAKQGKIDTKADFIITMTWPDSHPDDVDLYAEDPLGNIVWYHVREAGFMVLDRDDRGGRPPVRTSSATRFQKRSVAHSMACAAPARFTMRASASAYPIASATRSWSWSRSTLAARPVARWSSHRAASSNSAGPARSREGVWIAIVSLA